MNNAPSCTCVISVSQRVVMPGKIPIRYSISWPGYIRTGTSPTMANETAGGVSTSRLRGVAKNDQIAAGSPATNCFRNSRWIIPQKEAVGGRRKRRRAILA
jgi:hypothetical protein